MSQVQRRRIALLEKQAERFSEAIKWAKTQILSETSEVAMIHATNLGIIILYGDPKIGESLSNAWQRCREKRPEIVACGHEYAPFRDKFSARIPGLFCRENVLSSLSGADQKEKFAAMFASAPPWLVWFTYGDFTTEMMGIKTPDLSSVSRFVRSKATLTRWPLLPAGAFELCPWPDGSDNEPMTPSERESVRNEVLQLNDQMTPRERRRALVILLKYGFGR
jgi:hypothetical protein